jgi:23S rRNA (guanosine2251-2'-O)-methyltransferase
MSSISALIKAIESGKNDRKILNIIVDSEKRDKKSRELGFLKAKSLSMGFELQFASREDIDSVTIGSSHGGIIAQCTERNIPDLKADKILKNGVYFLLEGIEDPYNFGYSVRSLYAAGADGVILSPRNWMNAAGVVARSSAGASELIDMFICEPTEAVDIFSSEGYQVVCAGIRDSVSLFDADLKKPLLVILGGEKRGISRAVLEKADKIVRIDYGNDFGGSLSTAAATAVFAFEILRKNPKL